MPKAIQAARKPNESSPEVVLYIWEFGNAPPDLRRVVSDLHSGGWLALICPGGPGSLVEALVSRWHSSEHPVQRYELEDGGIVLASSRKPDAGAN